jgi:hypothetical protein
MPHAPLSAGGGREPVQVPGPFRCAGAVPAGVLGQRGEEPQPVCVGAFEVVLAEPAT